VQSAGLGRERLPFQRDLLCKVVSFGGNAQCQGLIACLEGCRLGELLLDASRSNGFLRVQADTNEVMAASVVYLSNVDVDRPLSKAAWNNSNALRHFSILRKLDGIPFPAGAARDVPADHASLICPHKIFTLWMKAVKSAVQHIAVVIL